MALLPGVGCLQRGLRILEKVCAFLSKAGKRSNGVAEDLEDPLHLWLRWEQNYHFPTAVSKLLEGKDHEEPLWKGYDITWEHKLIYIGGRTRRKPVPILHKESKLAKLWLLYLHGQVLRHGGGEQTLKAESRRFFWIFRGSSVFKEITSKCIHCKRTNPHERRQIMAPLPAFRLDTEDCLAFKHAVVDFAGPWTVKVPVEAKDGRRKKESALSKRYLLLICCGVLPRGEMRDHRQQDHLGGSVGFSTLRLKQQNSIPYT